MKKIAAIFIICLVQCTAIWAVIQPPVFTGLQSNNGTCCHKKCNAKQAPNTASVIGIFQPANRLNN